ncbi:MAG: tol-pal system protein YbgF [Rickettsia endosymbiont of Bryobia graminum]|nr:tol-pal system protein YbgF [Rickettsia endosymbiont of Bryobia graminum]
MRTIYILLSLIFSFQALAEEQIRSKPIQLALADNDDRLEHLEKANQQLLNRIEIAEHNIAKLEKVVNSAVQEEFTINNKPGAVKKADNNSNDPDIFGVIDEVANKNPATSNKNVTTDKHLYDLALASLKDKNLSDAEEKFAEFLKKYPNSPLVSNAYFWYGDIFYQNKMFDKAAINYLKGYKQSPKGDKASDSLLKSALSLGELKKNKEACSILSKLETEFPNRASASKKRAADAEIKYGCNKQGKK